MKHRSSFSPEADARIVTMYERGEPIQVIADAIGRTYYSTETRIRNLKVRRKTRQKIGERAGFWWTDEERRLLRENSAMPIDRLLELLPGRSRGAIYEQLERLGGNVEREHSRPLHTPFETKSGARAIRTKHGVVPYVPTIHDHLVGTV